MAWDEPLPKFYHPPLHEVVHGVQFPRLPMDGTHAGLFFLGLKDRYPRVQTVAPLPAARETFGGPPPVMVQMPFELVDGAELPRVWFVSTNDVMLVQLQPNRLLLNWRQKPDGGEYPHFESVSEEFRRVYRELEAFADEHELGPVEPEQCELTYINQMPLAEEGGPLSRPEHFFRAWHSTFGEQWDMLPEDVGFSMRFVMSRETGEPYGRLSVKLTPMINRETGRRLMQLDLTARGAPRGTDLASVVEFHEAAREWIVRCFAGMTTPAAHDLWKPRT